MYPLKELCYYTEKHPINQKKKKVDLRISITFLLQVLQAKTDMEDD